MNLSTRLCKELSEEQLDRPIRLMVDCGDTADITVLNTEAADVAHKRFMALGYRLLPKECPVVNSREIIMHYTSTTYQDWKRR